MTKLETTYRTTARLVRLGMFALVACIMASAGPVVAQDEPEPAEGAAAQKAPQLPEGVFEARHILIAFEGAQSEPKEPRTKEEAKALAEETVTYLKEHPYEFAAKAKELSDGPTAPTGGYLRQFRSGQMVQPFQEAVEAAEIGEIVGPVETRFGFHVIQRLPLPSAPMRAIIVPFGETAANIGITRTEEEAKARAEAALAAVRGGMDFAEAAREYSDASSSIYGGYVGYLTVGGQFPPTAIDRGLALDAGEVSEAFGNEYAYYIIKRISEEEAAEIEKMLDESVAMNALFLRYEGALNAPETVTRTKEEAQQLASDLAQQASGGENFAELVDQHSDSPELRERGGYMGATERRFLPPQLAELAFGLKIGQADTLETPEGFLVIQRVEEPSPAEEPEIEAPAQPAEELEPLPQDAPEPIDEGTDVPEEAASEEETQP